MNRAERRRQKKQEEKASKPPIYNYTPGSLRGQLAWEANQEYMEKVKKIKEEATNDAINTAMVLLFTLPCTVLMEHFWKKSAKKNVPEFLDLLLNYYGRWQNGELNMGKLKKTLWEIGGMRMEEEVAGYKNQAVIDQVKAEIKAVDPDLELSRVTAGDDMVAISVGLDVMEKGNKNIIDRLMSMGFRKIRRVKLTEENVLPEYQEHKYRVVLEKDLEVVDEK